MPDPALPRVSQLCLQIEAGFSPAFKSGKVASPGLRFRVDEFLDPLDALLPVELLHGAEIATITCRSTAAAGTLERRLDVGDWFSFTGSIESLRYSVQSTSAAKNLRKAGKTVARECSIMRSAG